MTSTAQKLLQEALELPEDDRVEILARLLESLDGPTDPGWDSKWLAELDRRTASAGGSMDWSEVRDDLIAELRGR